MLAIYKNEFAYHGCINCGCKNADIIEMHEDEYLMKCKACGLEFVVYILIVCKENSYPLYRTRMSPHPERPAFIRHPRKDKAWVLDTPKIDAWNINMIDHTNDYIIISAKNKDEAIRLHDVIKEVTQAAIPYSTLLVNKESYWYGCRLSRNDFNIPALYDCINEDGRITKEMLEKAVVGPEKLKIKRAKSYIEKCDNLDTESFREALNKRLSDYRRFLVGLPQPYYHQPPLSVLPHEAIGYVCDITDDYIIIHPGDNYYEVIKKCVDDDTVEACIEGIVTRHGMLESNDSEKEYTINKVRAITGVIIRSKEEVNK